MNHNPCNIMKLASQVLAYPKAHQKQVLSLVLIFILLFSMIPNVTVNAATFTVTKFEDTNDGVCEADCSLREAIVVANGTNAADTIVLGAGTYELSISGTDAGNGAKGDLDVTKPLTITGQGAEVTIIDANQIDRVFQIENTAPVVFSNLTITGGQANGSGGDGMGGGIYTYGSALTLDHVVVRDNHVKYSGGGMYLANSSLTTITSSSFLNNSSDANGGGIYISNATGTTQVILQGGQIANNTAVNNGGGIYMNDSSATLTQTGSTLIDHNQGGDDGGGIYLLSGTLLMDSAAFTDNTTPTDGSGGAAYINSKTAYFTLNNGRISNNSSGDGGGVYIQTGQATLNQAAVTRNTADNMGGGIYNHYGSLKLTNVTVSGNTALVKRSNPGGGGGIYMGYSGTTKSSTELNFTTIANNTTNPARDGAGGLDYGKGLASVASSIIAGNSPLNCNGGITSTGYNLEDNNTCTLSGAGDLSSTDPRIAALAADGTHPLLAGSPAVDMTPNGANGCAAAIAIDQRGVARPQGAGCDSGAYELIDNTTLPDLAVSDLFVDRATGKLKAAAANLGTATVEGPITAHCWVDGALFSTQSVGELGPGAHTGILFPQPWSCSAASDVIRACVNKAGLLEADPNNNCFEETWPCDTTPPVLVTPPSASNITTSAFTVTWATDDPATTELFSSRRAGIKGTQTTAPGMSTNHSITLNSLAANSAYYVIVRSQNAAGLAVESKAILVTTLAQPAAQPTAPTFTAVRAPVRYEKYQFNAAFADTSNIDRVEFLMDGVVVGVSYSPKTANLSTASDQGQNSLAGTYQIEMSPSLASGSRAQFYTLHQISLKLFTKDGHSYAWPFNYEPARENVPMHVEFVKPQDGEIINYIGSTPPPGSQLDIDVLAQEFEWQCDWKENYDPVNDQDSPPATCGDVSKPVVQVAFYINNEFKAIISEPITQDVFRYTWPYGGVQGGGFRLRAVASASDGTQQEINRLIILNQEQGKLAIERTVNRVENTFQVQLKVTNVSVAGINVTIKKVNDPFTGFQAANYEDTNITQRATYSDYNATGIEITPKNVVTLTPGQNKVFDYTLVPILYMDMSTVNYQIGNSNTVIKYIDLSNNTSLSVGLKYANPLAGDPQAAGGQATLAQAVGNAFARSDYLLITHPYNLAHKFGNLPIGELLGNMGELAALKQGVVAYVKGTETDYKDKLNGLLQDGSDWANRLNSKFQTRGQGYVLIVGETDVVAAYTTGPYVVNWGDGAENQYVKYSDNPYAHTDGNGAPDLLLGRIVGDTLARLNKGLRTAIDVFNAGVWTRSAAYAASGKGDGEGTFISAANSIAQILADDGISVSKHHWKDETFLRQFNFAYAEDDGFATGKFNGYDDTEDIVIASRADDKVYFLDGNGNSGGWFTLDFEGGDGFTVGDVDNDDLDEIVIGDRGNSIRCYSKIGIQEYSFTVDYSAYDEISVGDVLLSHPGNEIIMADTSSNQIHFFDALGNPLADSLNLGDLGYTFATHDNLATGNVGTANNTGTDEIVFSDRSHDKVVVISAAGAVVKELDLGDRDVEDGNGLAVGRVFPGSFAQIILGDRNNNVNIFSGQENNYAFARSVPMDFEQYDALAIRQLPGAQAAGEIFHADRGDIIHVIDAYYPAHAIDLFVQDVKGKDLVWLFAHGNTGGIGVLNTGNFPVDLGGARPIVTAFSCLTGDYVEIGGDGYGMVEAFFDSGAGIYLGSTEVSPSSHNSNASRKLFSDYWTPGVNFARALLNYKNARWGDDSFYNLWINEYNIYGDPKFDIFTSTVPALNASQAAEVDAASFPPQTTVTVDLPDFTVENVGGFDNVEIPGGDSFIDTGLPVVPTYSKEIALPAGVQVKDVHLASQSNLASGFGLNLPIADTSPDCDDCQDNPTVSPAAVAANPGGADWSPNFPQPFSWSVNDDPGHGSTLILHIYPFFYAPNARYYEYTRHFEFTVETNSSQVTLLGVRTDQDVYTLGSNVNLHIWAANSGAAQDVVVSASLLKAGSGKPVSGFDLNTLKSLGATGEAELTWSSSGVAAGEYVVQVELRDSSNNLLDRANRSIQLGVARADVTALNTSQSHFTPGAVVNLDLVFANQGELPLDGAAVIEIHAEDGSLVQSFSEPFSALPSAGTHTFSVHWNTTGMTANRYTVVAYLAYNSGTSASKELTLKTKEFIFLPVVRR